MLHFPKHRHCFTKSQINCGGFRFRLLLLLLFCSLSQKVSVCCKQFIEYVNKKHFYINSKINVKVNLHEFKINNIYIDNINFVYILHKQLLLNNYKQLFIIVHYKGHRALNWHPCFIWFLGSTQLNQMDEDMLTSSCTTRRHDEERMWPFEVIMLLEQVWSPVPLYVGTWNKSCLGKGRK